MLRQEPHAIRNGKAIYVYKHAHRLPHIPHALAMPDTETENGHRRYTWSRKQLVYVPYGHAAKMLFGDNQISSLKGNINIELRRIGVDHFDAREYLIGLPLGPKLPQ